MRDGRNMRSKSIWAVILLALCSCVLGCSNTSKSSDSTSRLASTATSAPQATGSSSTTSSTETGSSTRTTSGHSGAKAGAPKDFNDGDNDAGGDDDLEILDFGHAASIAQTRIITSLVKRYYAAAAADEGRVICRLLYSLYSEVIVENNGRPPGPPSLRGKTCTVVLSKIYAQQHKQMAADVATLHVIGVRVEGKKALALLHFAGKEEPRHIEIHKEFGTWKIDALLDAPMP